MPTDDDDGDYYHDGDVGDDDDDVDDVRNYDIGGWWVWLMTMGDGEWRCKMVHDGEFSRWWMMTEIDELWM